MSVRYQKSRLAKKHLALLRSNGLVLKDHLFGSVKFKSGFMACLAIFATLLTSCVTTKNVPYFQDLSSAEKSVVESSAKFTEPRIQNDDILSINIFTVDPQSAAAVNQVGSANPVGNQQVNGYLVDKNGEIELAVVGKVKLAGLTTYEARDLIRLKVSSLFNSPSVHVRFANFKVSVFGEVAKPSMYTVPNEKVSVLDALSLAGDLTIYGKRENVLLIRENNGKREFVRFNLNSSELFSSPYFYLRQNDLIYVEPTKARVAANNAARTQTITIISSVITVLTLVISRFF